MIALYIWEGKYPLPLNSHLSEQLLGQMDPGLNSLHKSCLLVISAKGTNRIDDPIHLFQGPAVHALVEFFEVGFDLLVLEAAMFVIGIVQNFQDAFGVVGEPGLQIVQVLSEGLHKFSHLHHPLDKLFSVVHHRVAGLFVIWFVILHQLADLQLPSQAFLCRLHR